jgi:ATP-dependent DNA ligase
VECATKPLSTPAGGKIVPCSLKIGAQRPRSPPWQVNEHIEGDGPTVFAHASKRGLEGIVSKRKDSTYLSAVSAERRENKLVGRVR